MPLQIFLSKVPLSGVQYATALRRLKICNCVWVLIEFYLLLLRMLTYLYNFVNSSCNVSVTGEISPFLLKQTVVIAVLLNMCLLRNTVTDLSRPCHSSDGQSLASHRGGPGSIPGQVMWDLWRTTWHWGRFSPSTSVPLAKSHSADCSTLIKMYHPGLVQ
jgi:hypothetical protein